MINRYKVSGNGVLAVALILANVLALTPETRHLAEWLALPLIPITLLTLIKNGYVRNRPRRHFW